MEEHEFPAFGDGINSNNRRKRRSFWNTEYEFEDISGLRGNGDDIVKLVRKMMFRTIDEAKKFYIAYGYRKERADELLQERESSLKPGMDVRLFCEWHIIAILGVIHSHELPTSETAHLLRCNRYLTSADETTLTHMTEIGIRPSKAMDFIQSLVGGTRKLPFTRKDGYNFLHKQKMEKVRYGDVNMAFNMLDGMRLHDSGFVLKHTENADGALATMFWCDSHSKVEYETFGDVLVLDSTYKTNTYHFPLVILSGVNNHASNCIFGARIDAMNDKLPAAVITDQDASICQAIQDEFPDIPHRLCCWHLCRNAKKRVLNQNMEYVTPQKLSQRVHLRDKSKIVDSVDCQATTVLRVQRILQIENGMKMSVRGPGLEQTMSLCHKIPYLGLLCELNEVKDG